VSLADVIEVILALNGVELEFADSPWIVGQVRTCANQYISNYL